jgi:hypothetical protein
MGRKTEIAPRLIVFTAHFGREVPHGYALDHLRRLPALFLGHLCESYFGGFFGSELSPTGKFFGGCRYEKVKGEISLFRGFVD